MTPDVTEPGLEPRHVEVPHERPDAPDAPEHQASREELAAAETGPAVGAVMAEKPSTLERFLPKLRRPKKIVIPQVRDEVTLKVEKILEEGLSDSFGRLSPVAQQEFKIRGEATSRKIRELLTSTSSRAKKIFRLILGWLKMPPGVNRYFLEQEAKIKTDRILLAKERLKEEGKL